jgi:hypothetical protein
VPLGFVIMVFDVVVIGCLTRMTTTIPRQLVPAVPAKPG